MLLISFNTYTSQDSTEFSGSRAQIDQYTYSSEKEKDTNYDLIEHQCQG